MLKKRLQNLSSLSWMRKLLILSLATSLIGILTRVVEQFSSNLFLGYVESYAFWGSVLSFVASFLCSLRFRPDQKQLLLSGSMAILTLVLVVMYIYPPWGIFYPSEDNPIIKYGFRWDPPSHNAPVLDGVYECVGILWFRSFILLAVSSTVILKICKEKKNKRIPSD